MGLCRSCRPPFENSVINFICEPLAGKDEEKHWDLCMGLAWEPQAKRVRRWVSGTRELLAFDSLLMARSHDV